mgnify:CR=1
GLNYLYSSLDKVSIILCSNDHTYYASHKPNKKRNNLLSPFSSLS